MEEISLDDSLALRSSYLMKTMLTLAILLLLNIEARAAQYSVDFAKGLQGCTAAFADYPVDPAQHEIYTLNWELSAPPNNSKQNALMITGTNRSDDLFMFGKCYIDAHLKPGSLHTVTFEIIASVDAPAGCFGAGGAPDALSLKAGASMIEPKAVSDGGSGVYENYVLNLDKGNQTVGGQDLAVISTSMNNGLQCEDKNADQFKTIVKRSSVATGFTVDSRGGFWIVWGTDSGYESTSTIYYQKINFEIQ